MLSRGCFHILIFIVCLGNLIGLAVPAQAKDEQITVRFLPDNGPKTDNPVILTLKGKTYPTNGWFDEMTAEGTIAPEEKFVIDAVAINRNGTMAKVRSLWTPDEQNSTHLFSDADVFGRSQSFFRRITRSAFLAKILYGDYIIFLVQHDVEGYGTTVHKYPVKKLDGKFYLTNRLKDDPVFLYLSEKYAKSLPLKKR